MEFVLIFQAPMNKAKSSIETNTYRSVAPVIAVLK
jgi:hypothetical protein